MSEPRRCAWCDDETVRHGNGRYCNDRCRFAHRRALERAAPGAPMCLWCHKVPVGTAHGPSQVAACKRKIPGRKSAWRNFCSRQCSGEHTQACQTPESRRQATERINAYNRERTKQRVIKTIREVLGQRYADGDPVTLAQVIRLVQLGYRDGGRIQLQRTRDARKKERIAA